MKSGYQGTCTNYGEQLKQQYVFQGVIVCSDCYKIVSHTVAKVKKELQMLFLTYTDMLRVALVRGEMRPAVLPKDSPQGTSREDFISAIKDLGAKHGNALQRAVSQSDLPPLQSGENNPLRQASDERSNLPISGRG